MQPRAEEIQRVLTTYVESNRSGESEGSRRRPFSLIVQGSAPTIAQFRELRGACAMVDIGSSIFTLAYSDILGIDPAPASEGGLKLTVRPGCFASHVAARLRRAAPRPWSSPAPAPPRQHRESQQTIKRREGERWRGDQWGDEPLAADTLIEELFESEGGATEGDPTGTESARQEIAGSDASSRRNR